MAKLEGEIIPPSQFLFAMEPRGFFGVAPLIAATPFLATAPRGAPQAVIVLPGLGATDRSTIAIRRYLRFLGYQAIGWNRGRNIRPAGADLPAVAAQIRSLREATGMPVSLVGWSRGGIIAREAARLAPDAARMVVTLGSPFAAPGAVECRRRMAATDRRGIPRADPGADARPRHAAADSQHLDLQPFRRRRGLAGVSADGRTSKRER